MSTTRIARADHKPPMLNGLKQRRKTAIIISATILALLGTGIVWRKQIHYHVFPKRWQTVYQGQVYRSGQLSATLVKRVLERHKIEVIVDLTLPDRNDTDQLAELSACKELDIEHCRFPLDGSGTGEVRVYANAVACIDRACNQGKRVLVHCAAGIHRTGGVLAAYRVLVRGEPLNQVYANLTDEGFWKEAVNEKVVPYLNQHMQEIAECLLKSGTIQTLPQPLPHLSEPSFDIATGNAKEQL